MDAKQFTELARQNFSFIPLIREVFADLDTPLSAYLKLANQPYSYLLESVQGGERWGRYSIIGLACATRIRVYGHTVHVDEEDQSSRVIEVADPLAWTQDYLQQYSVPKLEFAPRFVGGFVGYFGYDIVRYIEPRLANSVKPDKLNTPDILLLRSTELVVFDNLKGKLYLVVHVDPNQKHAYNKGQQRLDSLVTQLQQNKPDLVSENATRKSVAPFTSEFKKEDFQQAVIAAREYIKAGDVMQVVLSQRLSSTCTFPPINLYRALRSLNPSPYMYYFNLGEFSIVGSSPEILVRLENNEITVRPIAGTRPRGKDHVQDLQLEQELLADPKEIAEHLMLIDLGRNDVGRVVQTGSVKVTDTMIIERYSHVMHIVSNVVGRLEKNAHAIDVLRATFPAGTVTGAPKIRGMEIIDQLEPVKRGIYAGAVGYIAWDGNMDTAIAIRTAVIKDQQLYVQAGAGIVYDSVPEKEWEETMNKAQAIIKAATVAATEL